MSQEIHWGWGKQALRYLELQTVIRDHFDYLLDVADVFSEVLREYDYIV